MKLLTNTTLVLLFSLFLISLFSPGQLKAKFILDRLKHILIGLLLLLSLVFEAQESFRIDLAVDKESKVSVRGFHENSDGDYLGIYNNIIFSDTASLYDAHLIKISPYGDTSTYRFYKGNDTAIYFNNILQLSVDPVEYFVSGEYALTKNILWRHEMFLWLDADFNILREKKYQLNPIQDASLDVLNILKLSDGSFLEARSPKNSGYMYLFHFSAQGDSLNFRSYENDSAGIIRCLTYSPDSSAIWLHTHDAHSISNGPQSAAIALDENLNQTKVMYYPRWFGEDFFMSAKVLPNNKLIASSRYNEVIWPGIEYESYLATYIMDTGLNVVYEDYLTNPDTVTFAREECLDYYYPNQIFTGATHNHIYLDYPEPSWFVIAKYDSLLNLLYERYIGGDANYVLRGVCATSDSGVLLSGDYYDHTDEIERRKGVVIKLNPDGLLVGDKEYQNDIKVSKALIYPNPSIEKLMVRTTLKNCTLHLYSTNGAKVLSQNLESHITQINTEGLSIGTYVYVIEQNNKVVESGKWVKQ